MAMQWDPLLYWAHYFRGPPLLGVHHFRGPTPDAKGKSAYFKGPVTIGASSISGAHHFRGPPVKSEKKPPNCRESEGSKSALGGPNWAWSQGPTSSWWCYSNQ